MRRYSTSAADVNRRREGRTPLRLIGALSLMIATIGATPALADDNPQLNEPAIRFIRNAAGDRGIVMTMVVRADLQQAWSVLSRPDAGQKLFSNVKSIRPIPRRKGDWEYRLDSLIGEKIVNCAVRTNPTGHKFSWQRIGGDLEVFEGFFKLTPLAGHKGLLKVEYCNFIEPGGIGGLLMTERRRKAMVLDMVPRLLQLLGCTPQTDHKESVN